MRMRERVTTRRRFLGVGAAAAAAALGGCAGGIAKSSAAGAEPTAPKPARPPNVLFVTVDDLNTDLGCYGHRIVRSPNLDRLAEQGTRFDRAYCQFPVCNPSRSSLLTGLRPDTTGILGNRTPLRSKLPDVVTLPQRFRQNGYFTARLGKIFHGGANMDDPKAWDVALDFKPTPTGRQGERRNMTGGAVKWCWWMMAEGDDEDQPDGQIARQAARLLEEKRDRPFFLGVGFHKPHDPFIAPKKYFDLYPTDRLDPPREPPGRTPDLPLAIGRGLKAHFDRFTDRERREFMRSYYAGASFMDAQFGKVLAALDRAGLARSTIVIFLSDHGYHLGWRGWWNKNTLFEWSCRAPLLVRVPWLTTPGSVCSGLVEFVDLYPTLTDLCGLKAPANLAGTSLVPLLKDPSGKGRKAAYTQVQRGRAAGYSLRTERWRYTEWDGGKQGAELYDHHADPHEWRNLAGQGKYARFVADLKTLLRAPRA